MRAFGRIGLVAFAAAGALACDDGGKVSARPAYLAASTDVVDFGAVGLGDAEQRSLFLINKGDLPLMLQEPEGSTFGPVFKVILDKDQVAPTESLQVHLIFAPADPIDYETVITFRNDSANEGEFALKLKGTGKKTDPCKDKVCNSPPPRFCANSTTGRQFNPVGRCEAGNCVYDTIDETCGEFGCDSAKGQCSGDPCIGVSCQTPPNACFLQQGLCQRGACIYTSNDAGQCNDNDPCTLNDTCSQGNCHGTRLDCSGAPTQPPVCLSGTKLRKYTRTGACNLGVCVETTIDVDCEHGCETVGSLGQCKGDPCAVAYDDGNPCTEEYCDNSGWHSRSKDGIACNTGNGTCPRGTCTAGACLTNSGASCTANVDTSLCSDMDVPGSCTGDGRCLPLSQPQTQDCINRCGANHICLICEPIPGFGITLCL